MSEPITTPVTEPITPSEKTFTQTEVDAIVVKRLAKAMKGMPDEAELTAFRGWKENQQTEQERWNTLTTERDTARNELSSARAELEQMKREKILISKGVSTDDVDYYAYKIGKMVTDEKDFEQAATEFFAEKEHNSTSTVKVSFGGGFGDGGVKKSANDEMNALIRGARK